MRSALRRTSRAAYFAPRRASGSAARRTRAPHRRAVDSVVPKDPFTDIVRKFEVGI